MLASRCRTWNPSPGVLRAGVSLPRCWGHCAQQALQCPPPRQQSRPRCAHLSCRGQSPVQAGMGRVHMGPLPSSYVSGAWEAGVGSTTQDSARLRGGAATPPQDPQALPPCPAQQLTRSWIHVTHSAHCPGLRHRTLGHPDRPVRAESPAPSPSAAGSPSPTHLGTAGPGRRPAQQPGGLTGVFLTQQMARAPHKP